MDHQLGGFHDVSERLLTLRFVLGEIDRAGRSGDSEARRLPAGALRPIPVTRPQGTAR